MFLYDCVFFFLSIGRVWACLFIANNLVLKQSNETLVVISTFFVCSNTCWFCFNIFFAEMWVKIDDNEKNLD